MTCLAFNLFSSSSVFFVILLTPKKLSTTSFPSICIPITTTIASIHANIAIL